MTQENFIKGVRIIQKFYERSIFIDYIDEAPMVYFEKTDTPMNKEEVAALFELGWNQGEGRSGIYNPDKGWQIELEFAKCQKIKNENPLA